MGAAHLEKLTGVMIPNSCSRCNPSLIFARAEKATGCFALNTGIVLVYATSQCIAEDFKEM